MQLEERVKRLKKQFNRSVDVLEKECFFDVDFKQFYMPLEKKDWPQEDDKYWFVTTTGTAKDEVFTRNSDCRARKEVGNCYRTEEKALEKCEEFKKLLK
jgi:hypothetical protein